MRFPSFPSSKCKLIQRHYNTIFSYLIRAIFILHFRGRIMGFCFSHSVLYNNVTHSVWIQLFCSRVRVRVRLGKYRAKRDGLTLSSCCFPHRGQLSASHEPAVVVEGLHLSIMSFWWQMLSQIAANLPKTLSVTTSLSGGDNKTLTEGKTVSKKFNG